MKALIAGAFAAVAGIPLFVVTMLSPTPAPAAAAGMCSITGATGARPVGAWTAGLDTEQVSNFLVAGAVITARKAPERALVVTLITERQESGGRNLGYGDTAGPDSRGVMQQRAGWGPLTARMNPASAIGLFVDRLLTVAGWETMPFQHAAHLVQGNAAENDYTRWIPWAEQAAAAMRGGSGFSATCDDQATPVSNLGGTGNNVAGQTTIPPGLTFTGTAAGNKAVQYALLQLGKPYVWGAAGPAAFDCSGLVLAAWRTNGVNLIHKASEQMSAGTPEPVDLSTARSGDLVFIPGSDGTAAEPGHVGIVAGDVTTQTGRQVWIVQAPMTGIPVELTNSTEWRGQIVAVRRLA